MGTRNKGRFHIEVEELERRDTPSMVSFMAPTSGMTGAILFPVYSAAHAPVVQMAHKEVFIDGATAPPSNKAIMIAPQKPAAVENWMIFFDRATSPPATKTHGDEAHVPTGDAQQTGEHDGQGPGVTAEIGVTSIFGHQQP
jgi:hypothetical protein